jgi:predicted enzyme related to lactoylglutathione lyase
MANEAPKHGTFCWNELSSRDVPAAEKFYTSLLGWTVADSSATDMPYKEFKVGDKSVGGLMAVPPGVPEEVPSHWMAYITVDDVDECASKVESLGGKVEYGPEDIPKVGRFCVIQDPTGGMVGLIQFPAK